MAAMDLPLAIAKALPQPAAYVVASHTGHYLYKGSSRNLRERLKDHLAGREGRTKNRRPLFLVYYQYFPSYSEALKQERYLKSGQGRRWLEQILNDPNRADCSAFGGPATGGKSVG